MEGTTMFALIAFGALLLVLIAALGLPYPQTWHGRWGSEGWGHTAPCDRSVRYEWWVPDPTVLLLSTSDTDLITARASGATYRWANPSRLVDGELEELLSGASVPGLRILWGDRPRQGRT